MKNIPKKKKKSESMSIDGMATARHMKLLREQRKSVWKKPKRR